MTGGTPLDAAVRALNAGELVVYPTDTLLGLGARALDPGAVSKLIEAKGRAPTQPLSVAVGSYEEAEPWTQLSPARRAELRDRLPGPYTLLIPSSVLARRELAPAVLGPEGTLGLRIPDHPIARALAARCGPIVSTSANRHGEPPARTPAEARDAFGDRVQVYLPARPPPSGRPSELIDLTGARPRRIPRR